MKKIIVWRNISTQVYNRRLLSRIYKEAHQIRKKKGENPMGEWARDLNRYFMKERLQMVDVYERHSDSLITMEMQNETTVRCHYTR